ncbi:hypothetical protein SK128_004302, partial [Halocaridina rubra]
LGRPVNKCYSRRGRRLNVVVKSYPWEVNTVPNIKIGLRPISVSAPSGQLANHEGPLELTANHEGPLELTAQRSMCAWMKGQDENLETG